MTGTDLLIFPGKSAKVGNPGLRESLGHGGGPGGLDPYLI